MPNFLLEIGVEELPSSFVRHALESMQTHAGKLLVHHRLEGEVRTMGTARRLTLELSGVPEHQPDREETIKGPLWSVAFKDGEPSRAAIGFAKKNGVAVDQLEKIPGEKGDYAAAVVKEEGRPSIDVLGTFAASLCQRISFPKSMRWGEGEVSFGRPVHWILALFGDAIVPFDFANVTSARRTRGHRFLAPDEFEVTHADEYSKALADAHVIVDVEARLKSMHADLQAAAKELGGELVEDDFLLHECATLVERPNVVPGTFEESFLDLPEQVVISVMRDHQRYFAVRGADGLLPRYLNVVNTAEDPERIAAGNDRVLRARLKDAEFFVREDRKLIAQEGFEAWRTKLDSVVFQRKLGTVGDKVVRIETLASKFAEAFGTDDERAKRGANLCKADLESLIVFEFPELQGQMGAFYARGAGEDEAVARSMAEHYQPAGASDDVAPSGLGALLAVADRMDTLVGCFAIGQKPKGNADPFGLRRAALGVVRTAFEGPADVDLEVWIEAAASLHAKDPLELDELRTFFDTRLRVWLADRNPRDLVEACIGAWREVAGGHSLRDLRDRIAAVEAFRATDAYEPLAVAFKRAFNITREVEGRDVDPKLLEEGFEETLAGAFHELRTKIDAATESRDYAEALKLIAQLRTPIDLYFDNVFVMVEDPVLRSNRLALLGQIADCVSRIVHFHKLQPSST